MTDPYQCPAAVNLAGEHIACDEVSGHAGWPHGNAEHKMIWDGPEVALRALIRKHLTGLDWDAANGSPASARGYAMDAAASLREALKAFDADHPVPA